MHKLTALAFALLMGSGTAFATDSAGKSAAEGKPYSDAAAQNEKPCGRATGQPSGQAGPTTSATAGNTASTTGVTHDDFDPLTLDMDKDGYVTQAEAQKMVDSGKMDFNAMDADKDGRISAAEGKSFSTAARQNNQPGQAGQAGKPGEKSPKSY
ncbi:MAG: hypothetical protein H7X91_12360 [Burkholderiales bacterium]|nr:hypothetical protein [Burkholderiales bacterium]